MRRKGLASLYIKLMLVVHLCNFTLFIVNFALLLKLSNGGAAALTVRDPTDATATCPCASQLVDNTPPHVAARQKHLEDVGARQPKHKLRHRKSKPCCSIGHDRDCKDCSRRNDSSTKLDENTREVTFEDVLKSSILTIQKRIDPLQLTLNALLQINMADMVYPYNLTNGSTRPPCAISGCACNCKYPNVTVAVSTTLPIPKTFPTVPTTSTSTSTSTSTTQSSLSTTTTSDRPPTAQPDLTTLSTTGISSTTTSSFGEVTTTNTVRNVTVTSIATNSTVTVDQITLTLETTTENNENITSSNVSNTAQTVTTASTRTTNTTKQEPRTRQTTTTPVSTASRAPATLGPKKRRCYLDIVGKPVLHSEETYAPAGAWIRDANPPNDTIAERRWLMQGNMDAALYEFADERAIQHRTQRMRYYLEHVVAGNGLVVYNGSLYYHIFGSSNIAKYDLLNEKVLINSLKNLGAQDCPRSNRRSACQPGEREPYLYNLTHNFVDFAIDENGLWAVYHYANESYVVVSKIDEDTLQTVKSWRIRDQLADQIGNSFIMCGVFYSVAHATDKWTYVNYAFDLFEYREIDIRVSWMNPYHGTTMVDYNPWDKRLYMYDNGRLLSVPMRLK